MSTSASSHRSASPARMMSATRRWVKTVLPAPINTSLQRDIGPLPHATPSTNDILACDRSSCKNTQGHARFDPAGLMRHSTRAVRAAARGHQDNMASRSVPGLTASASSVRQAGAGLRLTTAATRHCPFLRRANMLLSSGARPYCDHVCREEWDERAGDRPILQIGFRHDGRQQRCHAAQAKIGAAPVCMPARIRSCGPGLLGTGRAGARKRGSCDRRTSARQSSCRCRRVCRDGRYRGGARRCSIPRRSACALPTNPLRDCG